MQLTGLTKVSTVRRALSTLSEPRRKLCAWKEQSPKPREQWAMRELHRGFWQKQTWPQKPFSSGRTHRHNVSELLRLSSLLQPVDSDRKDESRVDRNLLFPTAVTVPSIWFNCLLLSFNCSYFLILIVLLCFKLVFTRKCLWLSFLHTYSKMFPYVFCDTLYIIPILYTSHLILTPPYFSYCQFTLPVYC